MLFRNKSRRASLYLERTLSKKASFKMLFLYSNFYWYKRKNVIVKMVSYVIIKKTRLFSISQGKGFYPVLGQKFQPVKNLNSRK